VSSLPCSRDHPQVINTQRSNLSGRAVTAGSGFLCLLLTALPLPAANIAVKDVTLIDVASGAARPHMTVLIDDGKISRVGSTAVLSFPAATRIVPGTGKFLIPGLWDMHVHLYYKQYLPLFVAFGVTGVQDMGSDFSKVSAWRDEIEKGAAIGPHILTSGPPVDGGPSDDPKLPVLVARTADQGRQAFDKLYKMDVDFIKILSRLPRDAYFALAEQARHWDLRMVGHIPSNITAQEAVEARQKSLEHMFGIAKSVSTEEQALTFFERCTLTGTRVSPTLVLWLRMSHIDDTRLMSDPRLEIVPAAIRDTWPDVSDDPTSLKLQIWRIYRFVALAKRAKTEILAGTDTGDPYVIPGAALHDELEQLVNAGLTPREALEAATLAPARFFETEKEMGAIEKGKLADMVLLDANPLDDIRNVSKIQGVFTHGRYFARKDLDTILQSRVF
jgi:imidazolonepropionase-like amidohydrolase